jgi:dipeptidyl aminopeptidase/acylaminoacyl peptidase
VGAPNWTPDGRAIVFGSGPRIEDAEYAWRESEIYAADVATGTIRQLTTRRGPDGNPTISPDGRRIAYTGNDYGDYSFDDSELYLMNIDGTGARVLADLDRSPSNPTWAPDGSGVYFSVQDEGSRNLYFAPLDGAPRRITEGVHMLSIADIAADGTVVGTRTAPNVPGDIIRFNVRSPAEIAKLTDVNGDVLFGKKLGEVEEIWYTSVDDLRIQGWIVKPPDFDPARRYPLILSIHGGPHSMYNVGFNFAFQEHAANDYVVLYTNPRGSTGYGSAFGNAIKNAYPGKDYDDLMKGVDEVIAKGYIDTENLYVYGCSGGGVLTAWIVGHTNRFAAASSNCPVINWLSFVGTTDGAGWYRNFEKLPWEDPSEHLRRSPLMYVGNVTTPTMLMTGVNDLRTPITQTEEFYEALKVRRIPTAMVRFNDEWHGTSSRPSNFLRTQLYLRDWFRKHARGALKAVTEEPGG